MHVAASGFRHEPPGRYLLDRTGEDNGDARWKRQVMEREVGIAETGGKLDFGPWGRIFYGEPDGCRRERVPGMIIGDGSDPSGRNGRGSTPSG